MWFDKLVRKVYLVAPVGRHVLMRSAQQANALTIFVQKACAVAGVIRTICLDTRVWKKRLDRYLYFDTRHTEG